MYHIDYNLVSDYVYHIDYNLVSDYLYHIDYNQTLDCVYCQIFGTMSYHTLRHEIKSIPSPLTDGLDCTVKRASASRHTLQVTALDNQEKFSCHCINVSYQDFGQVPSMQFESIDSSNTREEGSTNQFFDFCAFQNGPTGVFIGNRKCDGSSNFTKLLLQRIDSTLPNGRAAPTISSLNGTPGTGWVDDDQNIDLQSFCLPCGMVQAANSAATSCPSFDSTDLS